jgi:hypothetical protein
MVILSSQIREVSSHQLQQQTTQNKTDIEKGLGKE